MLWPLKSIFDDSNELCVDLLTTGTEVVCVKGNSRCACSISATRNRPETGTNVPLALWIPAVVNLTLLHHQHGSCSENSATEVPDIEKRRVRGRAPRISLSLLYLYSSCYLALLKMKCAAWIAVWVQTCSIPRMLSTTYRLITHNNFEPTLQAHRSEALPLLS